MKRTLYIASCSIDFSFPSVHETKEQALTYAPVRIVRVDVDIPHIEELPAVEAIEETL